jgi:predicted phosphodiesterase
MPTIAFVGDTHGEIQKMYDWLWNWMERTKQGIDAVVQVGDFGIFLERDFDEFRRYWRGERKIPIRTWVCPGNHEDHTAIKVWQDQPDRIPNLHLMPDGGVTEIKGLKVASVWGNYSPKSWMDPRRVKQAREQGAGGRVAMHIYRLAVEKLFLAPPDGIDVLVTHDSPALPSMFPDLMQPDEGIKAILGMDADEWVSGCPGFSLLRVHFKPTHHFFGHVHVPKEVEENGCHIQCLQALQYQRDSESFHFLSF